jgi:hypothetical protein
MTTNFEYLTAALEAMDNGETARRALALVAERAPERQINDAAELVRALYDIGEGMIGLRIHRRIVELWEGKSADAIAGIYALIELLPHYAYSAFEFAVQVAQARAGAHPRPYELLRDIYFDREGFSFGDAWQYWGTMSPEAMAVARSAFIGSLLSAAGLVK